MKNFTEETIVSEEVFRGVFLSLYRDTVCLANGDESIREYVAHADGVVIVPDLGDDQLLMVRQYRHAAGRHTLEFPAGKIDHGESGEAAAGRELLEETGYRCGSINKLLTLPLPVAYVSASMTIYHASGLEHVGHPGEPGELIEVLELTLAEALKRIERGEICDMKDVLAVLLLAQHKKKPTSIPPELQSGAQS